MEEFAQLKDIYIEEVAGQFNKSLASVQKELAGELNKLVGSYYGRRLSIPEKAQLLNEIQNKLNNILLKTDYKSAVDDYLLSFDKINDLQKDLHKAVNGISLKKVPLNDYKKAQIEIVKNNLLGSGVNAKFTEPIKEILTRNVLVGTSLEDARDILEKYVVGDDSLGVLQKNIGQVASDTIRQYDGAINGVIKEEYGMNKIAYVNSNIKTTRGQCLHWTSFEFITDEQLEEEIPVANAGGTLGGYKCSGMIEGTDLTNFTANRGGYNCRHEAIPIY